MPSRKALYGICIGRPSQFGGSVLHLTSDNAAWSVAWTRTVSYRIESGGVFQCLQRHRATPNSDIIPVTVIASADGAGIAPP